TPGEHVLDKLRNQRDPALQNQLARRPSIELVIRLAEPCHKLAALQDKPKAREALERSSADCTEPASCAVDQECSFFRINAASSSTERSKALATFLGDSCP